MKLQTWLEIGEALQQYQEQNKEQNMSDTFELWKKLKDSLDTGDFVEPEVIGITSKDEAEIIEEALPLKGDTDDDQPDPGDKSDLKSEAARYQDSDFHSDDGDDPNYPALIAMARETDRSIEKQPSLQELVGIKQAVHSNAPPRSHRDSRPPSLLPSPDCRPYGNLRLLTMQSPQLMPAQFLARPPLTAWSQLLTQLQLLAEPQSRSQPKPLAQPTTTGIASATEAAAAASAAQLPAEPRLSVQSQPPMQPQLLEPFQSPVQPPPPLPMQSRINSLAPASTKRAQLKPVPPELINKLFKVYK